MNSYSSEMLERITNVVRNGQKDHRSYKSFENWKQYGVTEEQYIAVLPWLFDRDRNYEGRTVKGIGLIVPHEWVGEEPGKKMLFKQTGAAEIHKITYWFSSDSTTLLYDEETGYSWNNENPRYTVEDVVRGVIVNITEKAEGSL